MKKERCRRVCPTCWARNSAIVTGSGGDYNKCAFCGNQLKRAEQVLGPQWRWYFLPEQPWGHGAEILDPPPGYRLEGMLLIQLP